MIVSRDQKVKVELQFSDLYECLRRIVVDDESEKS